MPTDLESKLAEVREHIRLMEELARDLERAIETERRASTSDMLTKKLTRVNTTRVTDEHRINIAKGQKPGDKFMSAIAAKGFTQGQLAAAVGINPALLSMYRSGKRPIPEARARRIEELAGWKATLRNWPGGIVS